MRFPKKFFTGPFGRLSSREQREQVEKDTAKELRDLGDDITALRLWVDEQRSGYPYGFGQRQEHQPQSSSTPVATSTVRPPGGVPAKDFVYANPGAPASPTSSLHEAAGLNESLPVVPIGDYPLTSPPCPAIASEEIQLALARSSCK